MSGQLRVEGDPITEPFLTPVLPATMFNLRDQDGNEDGPFNPEDFTHDEDNVWYAQTEGRPIILRVVQQRGNQLWSIDGGGDGWQYEMIPVEPPVVV